MPTQSLKGLVINPMPLNGPAQMAADVLMLEKLILKPKLSLSLRFYQWESPYLSIGHNQTQLPRRWVELANKGELSIIRRPSGGGAVLHCNGLTYAIAWKSPPKQKRQAYFEASEWIRICFKELGLPLEFGMGSNKEIPENCFASSTAADLIDKNGCKRIGSAQLWRKGNLLQHGEILLNPPEDLWFEIFNEKAPPSIRSYLDKSDLENVLIQAFVSNWPGVSLEKMTLSNEDLKKIKQASNNYLVELPSLDSSTNPDEIIPLTKSPRPRPSG